MGTSVYEQTLAAVRELCEAAHLTKGQTLVVGCSTSEVIGCAIGSHSNQQVAAEIFRAIYEYTQEKGLYPAIQCCEHLNRAIVIQRQAVPWAETVNVVPQPKAGGSLAAVAYATLKDAVVVEEIRADAGLDIGLTLIGMHLKTVAVPLRLQQNRIGEAIVTAARTRAKFIGGSRAVYDETRL